MKTIAFGKIKFYYRQGVSDDIAIKHLQKQTYSKGVPEFNFVANPVVVDVGAHIGTFSIPIAVKSKKARVFAIEPSKESFQLLKKNIALNKLKNIFSYNIALFDSNGTAKLFHSEAGNLGHSLTKKSKEFETVKTKTLSRFFSENNIDYCDFLKMNCEGSEFNIILSANQQTLQKIKLLAILYHKDMNKAHSEKEIVNHLKSAGFFVEVRRKRKLRGWIIALNKNFFSKKDFLKTKINSLFCGW